MHDCISSGNTEFYFSLSRKKRPDVDTKDLVLFIKTNCCYLII